MSAHFCPSNPCPLCHPPSVTTFIEAGYVYAPYVPLVITPMIGLGNDESLTKVLTYAVPVLGHENVRVGDLVKIVSNDPTLEPISCGIYLGSEEFTPRGPILNTKVCIRHVFNLGTEVVRIDEGSGRVIEILSRVSEATAAT